MTNEEIDIRLRVLAEYLPEFYQQRVKQGRKKMEIEFELLNIQIMALTAILGELVKRFPEKKNDE